MHIVRKKGASTEAREALGCVFPHLLPGRHPISCAWAIPDLVAQGPTGKPSLMCRRVTHHAARFSLAAEKVSRPSLCSWHYSRLRRSPALAEGFDVVQHSSLTLPAFDRKDFYCTKGTRQNEGAGTRNSKTDATVSSLTQIDVGVLGYKNCAAR